MEKASMTSSVFERTETIKSWDDDYYHPIAERLYDRAIPEMASLLGASRGDTILDAGCGPGVHSIRLAREGYKVDAIDISTTMLSEAKRRVAKADLAGRITFQQQDLTKLSLQSGAYHFVFSWGVIIHIHNVEKALDELVRVVAPKGRLALYVTNQSAMDHKVESTARLLLRKPVRDSQQLKLGSGTWYTMHGERLWVWQFNISELVSAMSNRGMTLLHRRAGEFSEIQRRLPSAIRAPLLHLNNAYYNASLPAWAAITNLLVFVKA